MINRNMGCIEISIGNSQEWYGMGLIETWDVLKSFFHGRRAVAEPD